jgi:hypothetical protein
MRHHFVVSAIGLDARRLRIGRWRSHAKTRALFKWNAH